MSKIELYDEVELLKTLVEGVDYISSSKQNINKGSIGTVIEILDDGTVLVEFSYQEYKDPVSSVRIDNLKKVIEIF